MNASSSRQSRRLYSTNVRLCYDALCYVEEFRCPGHVLRLDCRDKDVGKQIQDIKFSW